uniref:Fatty acyl-CoA reductase n=1 Tax=Biomphalaria glabrata TaxID=6526 RepID=A0A2C9JZG6_BIOGL
MVLLVSTFSLEDQMMSNQPGSGVSYSAIDSDSRLDNPSVTEKAPFSQHQGEVSVKTLIGTNSQCDGDIDLTVSSSNKSDNCTMNTSSPSKSLTSVDTSILSPPHHWNGTHPATHFKSKSPKSHSVNTLSMDLTVPMFFSHKVIFITGATGFIGKVLIEKLLRSCPDLECVYCLIRPKNKQTIQDRLDEITNSKAFVHVSTAYANCDRPYIEEQVYPPPVEPQKIIDVLDCVIVSFRTSLIWLLLSRKTMDAPRYECRIISEQQFPNQDTLSFHFGFMACQGWIDNYNGPSGIYIAAGRGILRSMKGESSAIADIVPVDIPVNIMITVAWYTAVARPKTVLVYHATTGGSNPFTWGDMSGIVNKSFKDTPLEGCFRRPNVQIVSNSFLHDYWTCVSHLFPAYICDIAFRLMGKKPRFFQIFQPIRLRIIRYVFNSTVAVILWRVLIAKSQFARNLWFFIVGLVFKFVQYFRITSTMQKS